MNSNKNKQTHKHKHTNISINNQTNTNTDLRFDTVKLSNDDGVFLHHYATNITNSGVVSGAKMSKLVKEAQQLGK